ncbi:hypothetical protein [Mycobacteroides abscessus]|uniref:hypothetical protein n=1 Tax=Mycobacteroides abscessus TaxID=36809 RepID=UPI00092B165D|nr:hypothetical protein [Mycobacteroides abscessus]SIF34850.1 Uncharacterised protein [Mycobacteroides abscessus subsp. abscessus]
MTAEIRALVIPDERTHAYIVSVSTESFPMTLHHLLRAEDIDYTSGGAWRIYLDDRGIDKELPVNEVATSLWHLRGGDGYYHLYGSVVIVGVTPSGRFRDVPLSVVEDIRKLEASTA